MPNILKEVDIGEDDSDFSDTLDNNSNRSQGSPKFKK